MNIYIPSKNDLTNEGDTSIGCKISIGFNDIYQNVAHYDIWYELQTGNSNPGTKRDSRY